MATSAAPSKQVERPVSDPPDPRRRQAPRRRPDAGMEEGLMGVALVAGPANVIMQLASPGVGHGVLESRVESGRADLHPFKRARTTFTYLAVVAMGSEAQKKAYREAINRAHRQVRSTAESPVKYHALNPELQLWVAACLYKGSVDIYRMFYGEMDDDTADHYYQESKAFGTTLQVRPEMWPPDRAAFDRYWQQQLDSNIHIDEPVRQYLYNIATARARGTTLPGPLHNLVAAPMLLLTTGFLPQQFRDAMRLPWNETMQRQFDALIAVLRVANNLMPRPVRQFPFNVMMWDLDWRLRTGRPLV